MESWSSLVQQGVALTGRNRIGPPCSVGRQTAHAPSAANRPRPAAALQTTTITTNNRRQQAKQYWPIRRASNYTHSYRIRNMLVKRLPTAAKLYEKSHFKRKISNTCKLTLVPFDRPDRTSY